MSRVFGDSLNHHPLLLDEQLRFATALAHTAPGVALDLTCCNGDVLSVAYGRLGAHLTPCQLRCALMICSAPGVPRLVDAITTVEVSAGLDHLGGGLYGSGHGVLGSERWFVSELPHQRIGPLFATTPFDVPDDAFAVRLAPDPDLCVTAVRVCATAAGLRHLDEVAYWALSECMIAELQDALDAEPVRGPKGTGGEARGDTSRTS